MVNPLKSELDLKNISKFSLIPTMCTPPFHCKDMSAKDVYGESIFILRKVNVLCCWNAELLKQAVHIVQHVSKIIK